MRIVTESNPASKARIVARRRNPVSGYWFGLVESESNSESRYILFTLGGRHHRVLVDRVERHETWDDGFRALLRRTEVPS